MKQHKWHKEIKAWADGAEIEVWDSDIQEFVFTPQPNWHRPLAEFRIKPQAKEPQYWYVWQNHKGEVLFHLGDRVKETPIEYKYIGKIKLEESDK